MKTRARFPDIPPSDGYYESFYLKACDPAGARAVWIRHTVHKRPGEQPTGAVWMTYFDSLRGPPRAAKHQHSFAAISTPEDSYIRIGESEIGPGWARGSVSARGVSASWGLRFSDRHEPLYYLPREWMYRRPIPRTKIVAPHPGALFDGTIELNGQRIELKAWPGMVGHNWGSEHAERWVWIHGTGLGDSESTDYLDIAAGRVRLAGVTTPWIANGQLVLDGESHRLGGFGRIRGTQLKAEATNCRFTVPGDGASVAGTVSAPADQFVAWLYSDPSGTVHNALNCSIADLEFQVDRPGREPVQFNLASSAVYEYGSGETDHGIPVQPFPDG
jgi:hypothetical protein